MLDDTEIVGCPVCAGTGIAPDPIMVCCGYSQGSECCGDPEPLWEDCTYCQSTGQVNVFNLMQDRIQGLI